MNAELLNRVRYATCAIGYSSIPFEQYVEDPTRDAFEIVGSGFVSAAGRVLTCAHVIGDLKKAVERKRGARSGLQFVYPIEGTGWRAHFSKFEVEKSMPETDLAVLAFDTGTPNIGPIIESDSAPGLNVGDEIGTCGYPHGSILLRESKRVVRFGPIFQRGCIAAISPFEGRPPNLILLDLTTAPCASGSPVFRTSTGEIVGVLTRGQLGRFTTTSAAVPIFKRGGGILVHRVTPRMTSFDIIIRTADQDRGSRTYPTRGPRPKSGDPWRSFPENPRGPGGQGRRRTR